MNAPSKKALMGALYEVDEKKAERIRAIIKGTLDPETDPDTFKGTCHWLSQCHHRPSDVEIKMAALNDLLECFGVESVSIEGAWVNRYYGDTIALYCNGGDTYHTTLLYDTEKERFIISSWGDFYERAERKYKVCQYCGVAYCKDHKNEVM